MRRTAVLGISTAIFCFLTWTAQAQVFSVVHAFQGPPDGANPMAGFIRDSAGNLYATTDGGGAYGWGTVFKVNASGQETVLYSFTGGNDGGHPTATLVRDSSGNLYGTAQSGGKLNWGTVFKLNSAGKLTVLHTFTGGKDGGTPRAGLIRDSSGNLYGTTSAGGAACLASPGCGVIFKLTSAGTETVLHTFTGSDGAMPAAALIRDSAGNLYGTTTTGGNLACGTDGPYGCGTVFKLSASGTYTVLHKFNGGSDGMAPSAPVIRDSSGTLYGTTTEGGSSCSCGIVFALSSSGKETILYSFKGGSDGSFPQAGLVRDASGNLYGTTEYGGAGYGTVFQISPTQQETVLHVFDYNTDGAYPLSNLVRDSAGNLYGTTSNNGPSTCNQYGCGTVFEVAP